MEDTREFPNGFRSYAETLINITQQADWLMDTYPSLRNDVGSLGLYAYFIEWAFEFESTYEGFEWDGEWEETVEQFVKNKIYEF